LRKENDGYSLMGNLKINETRILKIIEREKEDSKFIESLDCYAICSHVDKHYLSKVHLGPQ